MSDLLDLRPPEPQAADEPVPAVLSFGPEVLSWTVEHAPTERERNRERILMGSAVVIGGLVSWWQASWLTFAVVLLGVAAWELHGQFSSSHTVAVDDKGVVVDGYRHRYEHLHSFDMHGMPDGSARLSIKTTRWHLPHLHVPLGDQDPEDVRALLSRYLLQDEHRIPLLDYFLKK